ncbi:hypothetical protein QM565_04010 [Geitlerinema splendidum]|nr:hypothetical protein [Geitlerinema splendidum]
MLNNNQHRLGGFAVAQFDLGWHSPPANPPGITGEPCRHLVGAGSVVTKNIPANVVAVGNPCRVIRELDSEGN